MENRTEESSFWIVLLPLFFAYRRFLAEKVKNVVISLGMFIPRRISLRNVKKLKVDLFKIRVKHIEDCKQLGMKEGDLKNKDREVEEQHEKTVIEFGEEMNTRDEKERLKLNQSEILSFFLSAMAFLLLSISVTKFETPIADYLNQLLDQQAETYKQEEQKRNEVPSVSPTSTPSPTPTPSPSPSPTPTTPTPTGLKLANV